MNANNLEEYSKSNLLVCIQIMLLEHIWLRIFFQIINGPRPYGPRAYGPLPVEAKISKKPFLHPSHPNPVPILIPQPTQLLWIFSTILFAIQAGVFTSRSSVQVLKIRNVAVLNFLQAANMIIWIINQKVINTLLV